MSASESGCAGMFHWIATPLSDAARPEVLSAASAAQTSAIADTDAAIAFLILFFIFPLPMPDFYAQAFAPDAMSRFQPRCRRVRRKRDRARRGFLRVRLHARRRESNCGRPLG